MVKHFDVDIIFFGVQGAGKGTQVAKLWGKYGKDEEWFLAQTGNILRDIAKKDTELGSKVRNLIDAGELVSDELVNEVIFETLKGNNINGRNWMFDGYPRNISQAESFYEFYQSEGRDRLLVFHLNLGLDEAMKRVESRLICKNCNAIATERIGLKEGDVCKHCKGGILYKRADEKDEQAIHKRFQLFQEKTLPVYEYFKSKNILIKEIDASQSIKEVSLDILESLESFRI